MKRDNRIHRAIDESLDSVRFNAHDMRTVMRAVHSQGAPRRVRARKKRMRLDFIFAMSLVVLIIAPLSVFALRSLRAQTSDITDIASITAASSGEQSHPAPGDDVILAPLPAESPAAAPALSESDAIQAARACFEAHCDTTVFTFEEYTVSVRLSQSESSAEYVVEMRSIYDNGCLFTVVVDAISGQVVSYSTPKLATMPTYLDSASSEIQAWYDKHGEYIFTWQMDVQAEFSRRYEGAMLRMPRGGEKDAQYIAAACVPKFHSMLTENADESRRYSPACYPMLYSERAFSDGQARYRIYCFALDEETNEPLDSYLLATMLAADGTIESTEILPISGL